MSSQENNHQNDNQLLIDFIKDTYTIESNKHLFICIPYLINGLSGYEGTYKHSLSANGIELISSSEQKTQNQNEQKGKAVQEYIDKDDLFNILKYKVFNSMQIPLYRFNITDNTKIESFFLDLIKEYKKSFNNLIENQKDYKYLYSLLKNIKESVL